MANIDVAKLTDIAREGRVQILRMLTHAGSGHPGGSLSVIDILTALYFHRMRYQPANPRWEGRDRFILSKGHCVPAQYFCMAPPCGPGQRRALATESRPGGRGATGKVGQRGASRSYP